MGSNGRKQYSAGFKREAVAFPGNGQQTPEQVALHGLREENRWRRMERDILKKATAFFASESP